MDIKKGGAAKLDTNAGLLQASLQASLQRFRAASTGIKSMSVWRKEASLGFPRCWQLTCFNCCLSYRNSDVNNYASTTRFLTMTFFVLVPLLERHDHN